MQHTEFLGHEGFARPLTRRILDDERSVNCDDGRLGSTGKDEVCYRVEIGCFGAEAHGMGRRRNLRERRQALNDCPRIATRDLRR